MKAKSKSTDPTLFDPNQVYHKLTEAGNDWADKNAAANLLEKQEKNVLANIAAKSNEKSEAAKMRFAEGSDEYKQHTEIMTEARREATRAKVTYDGMKIWIDMKLDEAATKRAEMKL